MKQAVPSLMTMFCDWLVAHGSSCLELFGVVLGIITAHPWLLVVLVPIVGAGGFFFWKYKSAQDRRDQELRDQYRRDVLADRADYEDRLYAEGDPRGTYGRYPPPKW